MWMVSFCRCFASAHKCTAIFCNADWTQMAAEVPAEWTVPLSRIRCCVFLLLFFNATFNFILTRVRGEIFFKKIAWGCGAPGPHVVEEIHWQKPLRRRVSDVACWRSYDYELPSTAVPGPRLMGVSRLLQPWSLLLCIAFPLSGRIPVPPNSYGNLHEERWGRIQPAFLFYPFPGCDHTQILLSLWFSPLNKCEAAFYHSLYTLSIKAWRQTK